MEYHQMFILGAWIFLAPNLSPKVRDTLAGVLVFMSTFAYFMKG